MGWFARRGYVRICNGCGEGWPVTRAEARRSPGRMPRPRRTRASGRRTPSFDFDASRDRFDAMVEQWQAYRRCPRCGTDDFTQVKQSSRV